MAEEPKDMTPETPKGDAAPEKPEPADTAQAATSDSPSESPSESPSRPQAETKPVGEAASTPDAQPGGDAPKSAAKPAKPAATGEGKPKGGAGIATTGEVKTDTKSAVELLLDPGLGDQPKIVKAKGSKNVHSGIAHVLATFNNTIVSITDANGNVIGWSSAGKCGFKGSRKSTAYAAQMVAQDASRQAMGHGLKEVEVRVKGPGSGRESAVRALQAIGLDISLIRDVTPVPHNGCRPPKQRRV